MSIDPNVPMMLVYETAADLKSGDAYVLPLVSGVPMAINLAGEVRPRYGDLPVYSPRFAKLDGTPVPGKVPGANGVNVGTMAAVAIVADGEVYNGVKGDRPGRWTFPAIAMAYTFTTDGPDTSDPGALRVRPVVSEVRKGTGTDTAPVAGKVNVSDLLANLGPAPAPAPATTGTGKGGKVRVTVQ